MDTQDYIQLRYHFHLQKVGRQYLAITTGEEARLFPQVLCFNETGAEICGLLQEQTTRAEVLDKLCSTYDAPQEELQQCLDDVLHYMHEAGALV